MRQTLCVLVLASALAASGCRGGFKSSAGGATTPTDFGKGASHSLVFSDEGGLLTRAGVAGLGLIAAAGAVENVKSTSEVNTNGNTTVVTTTTTGTINQNTAAGATKVLNAAGDSKQELGTTNGSLAANLEIASTTLGGDTSGGQFDFGYGYHVIRKAGPLVVGVRAYAGFGYGHFTFHDRVLEGMDRGPPKFGDGTFTFLGIPTRLGAFVLNQPRGFSTIVGMETFVKVNINFDGATVFHAGQRLQYSLAYVEAEVSRGTSSDVGSLGLELGLGF